MNGEDDGFIAYLKKVENCLHGRSRIDTDTIEDEENNDKMKVVRRVLDEKTVLEMVSTFLKVSQEDDSVPKSAKVTFDSCHFDEVSGLYVLKAYLNYYKMSKVIPRKTHLLGLNLSEQAFVGLSSSLNFTADRKFSNCKCFDKGCRHQCSLVSERSDSWVDSSDTWRQSVLSK